MAKSNSTLLSHCPPSSSTEQELLYDDGYVGVPVVVVAEFVAASEGIHEQILTLCKVETMLVIRQHKIEFLSCERGDEMKI
jgi:hypothetical protein